MPIDAEPLFTGGMRFKKAELLELSLVSVPANPGATITEVKAIDAAIRRGDIPAPADSALWRKVSDAGRAATHDNGTLNGAYRVAANAGSMSIAMCKTLARHIEDLERRLASNEIKYLGVWKADRSYPAGCFVSHNGSMWHCDKATDFKPGEGGGWTLAVKRGADAK